MSLTPGTGPKVSPLIDALRQYEAGKPVRTRLTRMLGSSLLPREVSMPEETRKRREKLPEAEKLSRMMRMRAVLDNEPGTGPVQADLRLRKWFERTFRISEVGPISNKTQWREAHTRGFTHLDWKATKQQYKTWHESRNDLLDQFYQTVMAHDRPSFAADFPELVGTMDAMNNDHYTEMLMRENPLTPPSSLSTIPSGLIWQLSASIEMHVVSAAATAPAA